MSIFVVTAFFLLWAVIPTAMDSHGQPHDGLQGHLSHPGSPVPLDAGHLGGQDDPVS